MTTKTFFNLAIIFNVVVTGQSYAGSCGKGKVLSILEGG